MSVCASENFMQYTVLIKLTASPLTFALFSPEGKSSSSEEYWGRRDMYMYMYGCGRCTCMVATVVRIDIQALDSSSK